MTNEELLDAYFEGSLSDMERKRFELLLKNDPSFNEEFEFQKEVRQALRKKEHQEIRDLFSDENDFKEIKHFTIRRYIPALIAASVLLIVTLGYFLTRTPDTPDSSQLFIAYFEPYENVIHPIERGNPRQDLISRAFYAYENGQYEEAIELFRQLAEQQPDPYIDFYSGIVLLQLDRNTEAIDRFLVYLDSDGKLKDRASWYLALGYLKNNEKDKAVKILQDLASENSYKSEAAGELLDLLN